MKHQFVVNLPIEQQRLRVMAFDVCIKPGAVTCRIENDRHSRMDVGDAFNGGCGDDRATGHAKVIIVCPKASKGKALALWQLQNANSEATRPLIPK